MTNIWQVSCSSFSSSVVPPLPEHLSSSTESVFIPSSADFSNLISGLKTPLTPRIPPALTPETTTRRSVLRTGEIRTVDLGKRS
ncbi:hypothetical protein NQZ68_025003 [Dissostichus eleginoides]|nr:hypothetical protein NQZ68_025003 [Dissostichus eleginoides]